MTNQMTSPITNENIEAATRILQGFYTTSPQFSKDAKEAVALGLIEYVRYEGYVETALLVELTKGN